MFWRQSCPADGAVDGYFTVGCQEHASRWFSSSVLIVSKRIPWLEWSLYYDNRVTTGGFSWNNETVKGSVLHNRNITEMAKYANNYLLGLSILSEHRPLMNCLHHQPDAFGGGINEEITRSLLVILQMSGFFRILKASFRGRGTRQCHFECWLPAAQLPTPPPLPLPNGLEDWPVSQPLCGVESLTGVHRRPTSC